MNIAVIFAGGVGRRMNARALPKQFLKVYGKEIIVYTLEHFQNHPEIDAIVIACVEDWIPFLSSLVPKYDLTKVKEIVPGGKTGQDSIRMGLLAAKRVAGEERSVALIHDGVRPLINEETITQCLINIRQHGSAVTVAPVIETIIRVDQDQHIDDVIDRSSCLLARAPQCFYLDEILEAHAKAVDEGRHDFIDSATLMKYYGYRLSVVDGPKENIKITTPMDYYTFKAMYDARENEQLFGE